MNILKITIWCNYNKSIVVFSDENAQFQWRHFNGDVIWQELIALWIPDLRNDIQMTAVVGGVFFFQCLYGGPFYLNTIIFLKYALSLFYCKRKRQRKHLKINGIKTQGTVQALKKQTHTTAAIFFYQRVGSRGNLQLTLCSPVV